MVPGSPEEGGWGSSQRSRLRVPSTIPLPRHSRSDVGGREDDGGAYEEEGHNPDGKLEGLAVSTEIVEEEGPGGDPEAGGRYQNLDAALTGYFQSNGLCNNLLSDNYSVLTGTLKSSNSLTSENSIVIF